MPRKKKLFTKENSVKYLLIQGNDKATNADGETLKNIFVPVSQNYKQGSSLFMPKIANICGESAIDAVSSDADLKKIVGAFDEDFSDEESEILASELKNIAIHSKQKSSQHYMKKVNIPDEDHDKGSNQSDVSSQFSDADSDFDDVHCAYTLSSVKSDCPESVKTFNERFEKLFEEYDEGQIGALDDEEICGIFPPGSERVKSLADSSSKRDVIIELENCDESLKEKILRLAEEEEEEKYIKITCEKPLEYDCESILSTYSNIYNHPYVIKEQKIKKIKVPNSLVKKGLTKSHLKQLDVLTESEEELDDDEQSMSTNCNVRVKGETPEQRRERKKLFKEAKRESRIMKKENKLAFKNEKKLQTAQILNIRRNAGIKLV